MGVKSLHIGISNHQLFRLHKCLRSSSLSSLHQIHTFFLINVKKNCAKGDYVACLRLPSNVRIIITTWTTSPKT